MYNKKQQYTILKAIHNNLDSGDVKNLLTVYLNNMSKGLSREERLYINEHTDVEWGDPYSLMFIYIILMGYKKGTMKEIAELTKQELTISDIEYFHRTMEGLGMPEFDKEILYKRQELYNDYIKS